MKRVTTITIDDEVLKKVKPLLQKNGYKLSSFINMTLCNYLEENRTKLEDNNNGSF